jgi:6-phosphogluconolactonase/glucosamine-6-phosphate isomerase/deaminase
LSRNTKPEGRVPELTRFFRDYESSEEERMKRFTYSPSKWVPFRDVEVLERVRRITRDEIDMHPNPEFRIKVVPDDQVEFIFVTDMFYRIKKAAEAEKACVFILPNPNHGYIKLAHILNKFQIDCRHLQVFIMDEYADEEGNVAPESYPQGFMRSFKNNFYKNLDPDLRPPEGQIHGPTTEKIKNYGRMIADFGGADVCYSGPGWTGHLAFIEPDAPEFDAELEEWRKMGPRIVTLSPFTIAQNSLHGSFGMSGDLALVPPKAATIGPAEVVASKHRVQVHALSVAGTGVSWQRFVTRLILHGPVTPRVPESLLQTLPTDVLVSENSAQNIEPRWDFAY